MSRMLTAAVLTAGLLLTGCVSVLPKADPASPRYLIEPVAFDETAGDRVAWSLAIEDPLATRVYDNTKIALVREAGRVEYFANGEWADRAPRLVQAALIRSFENSNRILGVGDRSTLTFTDFVLQTDIRKMHADYTDGGTAAVFSVYARLMNGRGKVLAARLFERRVDADAATVPQIAAAFDTAVGDALGDIVEWSITEANAAYAK